MFLISSPSMKDSALKELEMRDENIKNQTYITTIIESGVISLMFIYLISFL